MNIKIIINQAEEKINSVRSSASESFRKFWKPDKVYIVPNLFGIIWAGSSLYMYILYFISANTAVLVLSVFMTAFWIFDMLYSNTLCKSLSLSAENRDFTADALSEISVRFENFQELQSVEIFSEGNTPEPKIFFFNSEKRSDSSLQNPRIAVRIPFRTHLRQIRFRLNIRSAVGFFICWKYTDVQCNMHIWPKSVLHLNSSRIRDLENAALNGKYVQGTEDFYEYRNYTEGESLSRIDWKAFARRGRKLTKHFSSDSGSSFFIDWNRIDPALGFEERLETARALLERYMEKGRVCFIRIPVQKEIIQIENRIRFAETLNLFSEASEEDWRMQK